MSHRTRNINELGLGEQALQDSSHRILNPDGTFNVTREGHSFWHSVNPYHVLLSVSWTRFNLMLLGLYLSITAVFAFLYFAVGRDAISGSTASSTTGRLAEAFYFSVQTITTVGYGHLLPNGTAANLLVTLEAAIGMAGIAVAAGLIFARVAAPSAKIQFSRTALIDTASENPTFRFRLANGARSELVDAKARVILVKTDLQFGIRIRRFHELALEHHCIAFFPLEWTVVHPITADSPLYGMSPNDFEDAKMEFLVLINAIDDAAFQTLHARTSYRWDEVTWNMRFVDMYRRGRDGRIGVNLGKLNDVESLTARGGANATIWET